MKSLRESLFDSKTQMMESLFDKNIIKKAPCFPLSDLYEYDDKWIREDIIWDNLKDKHFYNIKDKEKLHGDSSINELIHLILDIQILPTTTKRDLLKEIKNNTSNLFKKDVNVSITLFDRRGYPLGNINPLLDSSIIDCIRINLYTIKSWPEFQLQLRKK